MFFNCAVVQSFGMHFIACQKVFLKGLHLKFAKETVLFDSVISFLGNFQ